MAKKWAKKLYNSKNWKDCRDGYFQSKHGICELCDKPGLEVHHKEHLTPNNIDDPNISFNWDNLQLLCRSCHNAIHEKEWEMTRAVRRKSRPTMNGLTFDDNGNLIEEKNVYIVWGSPASGKTTYVKEHKGKYDLIVELDPLIGAISMTDGKTLTEDYLPFALELRDTLYRLIEQRKYHFDKAWIIAGLPNKAERLALQSKLKAELIHIDTPIEICLKRAKLDDERKNKELQYKIINNYFDKLEI